ncbi:sigma-54-dependent Fis family transcriptional regulator [Ilyomonas limi]|uniref:Sigma-54-dependent Fis family transcriptional regulator n=1 Tax=Ilyomonas limi TaxID=2575867 RepID=A0A4U3LA00_9BACT|nr:sigma-54 dependent transcriptional regulator [Ilyomonas limi]TKK71932.1 sigma-54-dependent Fis family transcriptional regulator [Ilyomonas limi]
MKKRILIIDDDIDICTLLSRFLNKEGYETEVAYTGSKGIAKFKESNFDVVLCDYRLGDKDGRDVLGELKTINPQAVVLIITGYSDIKTAVEVIKLGAYDYITKPLIPAEVLNVISSALKSAQAPVKSSVVAPSAASAGSTASGTSAKKTTFKSNGEYLIGESESTKELYRQIEIIAPTNYSIILYGESGTGKEVIAKTIHHYSDRRNKPFIAMDCGTLSKELAGSEMFGHVKGAFTGALADKEGHFEMANGGTLFLDEVANLGLDIQATLLRVIQERKFKRVGGTKEMDLDIRIIVASNENLQEAYHKGKFREDLYHRFNEFSINLPPLRQRRQDIPLFAQFFLDKTNEELHKNIEGFDEDVMNMFLNYSWPGNLREFRNVVRRAVLLTTGNRITAKTLPWEITNTNIFAKHTDNPTTAVQPNTISNAAASGKEIDLKDAAAKAEYETIMNLLKEVNNNKSKAAEILKIDRKTLYNKIKSYEESKELNS